jgi:hypothetical protein
MRGLQSGHARRESLHPLFVVDVERFLEWFHTVSQAVADSTQRQGMARVVHVQSWSGERGEYCCIGRADDRHIGSRTLDYTCRRLRVSLSA